MFRKRKTEPTYKEKVVEWAQANGAGVTETYKYYENEVEIVTPDGNARTFNNSWQSMEDVYFQVWCYIERYKFQDRTVRVV